MVYILLADGFEETEALVPCDLLRRAGINVQLAGIGGTTVTGSHAITVVADTTLEEITLEDMELLLLPGGLRGVQGIQSSAGALALIRRAYAAEKTIAAICAAPTILAALGITDGKAATCYPGMQTQMGTARMQNEAVVVDGSLITGRAAGSSIAFALRLITVLRGEAAAQRVAQGIVC